MLNYTARLHLPAPDAAVAQLQLHDLRVHRLLRRSSVCFKSRVSCSSALWRPIFALMGSGDYSVGSVTGSQSWAASAPVSLHDFRRGEDAWHSNMLDCCKQHAESSMSHCDLRFSHAWTRMYACARAGLAGGCTHLDMLDHHQRAADTADCPVLWTAHGEDRASVHRGSGGGSRWFEGPSMRYRQHLRVCMRQR